MESIHAAAPSDTQSSISQSVLGAETRKDADDNIVEHLIRENTTLRENIRRLEQQLRIKSTQLTTREQMMDIHLIRCTTNQEILTTLNEQRAHLRQSYNAVCQQKENLNLKLLESEEARADLAGDVAHLRKNLEHAENVRVYNALGFRYYNYSIDHEPIFQS
jgi:chromosome segregation ATPase